MRIERERFLGAGHYERSAERRGYGNGSKLKQLDTLGDMVSVEVPKSAGHVAPFYPQSLERGRRSSRAVMAKFGLESLSSSQVSRGAKLLDEELEAWRKRPLGCVPYLLLDARYEKMRVGGIVRDCAVLTAIGIGLDQRRHVLGVSCALSEAEVHWRYSSGESRLF